MITLKFSKKAILTVLLVKSSLVRAVLPETQVDHAENESPTVEISNSGLNQQGAEQKIVTEFESYVNYWAFNGTTSKDETIVEELLTSAADLSESVGLGNSHDIKALMVADTLAQSGPNVILSQRTIPLIQQGIEKGQFGALNRFLSSMSKVNSKLSSVAGEFTNFAQGKPFSLRAELGVSREGRVQCLQTCATNFLRLQSNNTFLYMMKMRPSPSLGTQHLHELTEITRRFPNSDSSNGISNLQRRKFNPAVALTSDSQNACYSSCTKEIWTHAASGAGLGTAIGIAGGPTIAGTGAVAGAVVGAAVGTAVCTLGPECSNSRVREEKIKQKEMDLKERELALREKELRDKEKAQRERKEFEEKAQKTKQDEIARKNLEGNRKKAEKEEKEMNERERKIRATQEALEKGDWADRKKNKDAEDDSSASCNATRTCDGSMTVLKAKDDVDQPTQEKVDPEEIRRRKKEMNSMPISDNDVDGSKQQEKADLEEIVRLKKETTSTPMPFNNIAESSASTRPKIFDNRPNDWESRIGKLPKITKEISSIHVSKETGIK